MSASGATSEDPVRIELFRIHSYETDIRGRASVAAICNFFQDIAGNHATVLNLGIGQLNRDSKTWVLSRLKVEVQSYPVSGDTVKVETWPSGVDGLFAMRCFRLWTPEGNLLVRAVSAWVIIDLKSRRPVRIPAQVAKLGRPEESVLAMDLRASLNEPKATGHDKTFRVRWGDMDVNRHVNNVRYIEWGLEALPHEFLEMNELESFEIQFKAECAHEDMVTSVAGEIDSGIYAHGIKKDPDGEILALMETRWKSR